jgi:hypothetical protein
MILEVGWEEEELRRSDARMPATWCAGVTSDGQGVGQCWCNLIKAIIDHYVVSSGDNEIG